ncbi:MAG: hypothetical protein ABIO70_13630 [Pseudomonadota bacterium]
MRRRRRAWPALEVLTGLVLLGALGLALGRQHERDQAAAERIADDGGSAVRADAAWAMVRASAGAPPVARPPGWPSGCTIAPGVEGLAAALHEPACSLIEADLITNPPADPEWGRLLVAAVGPDRLLGVAQVAPLVVLWFADQDPATLDEPTLLLLAESTARLLGADVTGTHEGRIENATRALAGQEALRAALEARCGACAPTPAALPGPSDPGRLPASVEGEHLARSGAPTRESTSELGAMVGIIRRGGEPPADAWERVGFCGMAALELARARRVDQLEALLHAAVHGPAAMDRLAALYAAAALRPPSTWPRGPARNRAERLGLLQGAAIGSR